MAPKVPDRSAGDVADDPRARILESAARVIAERGGDHARYVDIARAAGVSVGSIQHYFDGRAALLSTSFIAFNEKSDAAARAIYEREANPLNRLVELIRFGVEGPPGWGFDDTWSVWLEYWSSSNRDPGLRQSGATIYDVWRTPFHETLADGAAQGLFELRNPPEDTVDRIIGCMEGLATRVLLEPDRMTPQRMFSLLLDLVSIELGVKLTVSAAA
jgi:AcrR family transcriptional regulator